MRRPEYKYGVLVVYVAALFIQILDATVVNVALPSLGEEFGVDVTDVDTVAIAFSVALAMSIPAAGWLSDRFGSKTMFLASLAVFTAASALCGAAATLDQLVAFRILQGIGAGLITPVGSAMLFRAFPLEERAIAANAVLSVAVVAPALGPVLGGLIVDTTSWRWIFYLNVPIGVPALIVSWWWLRQDESAPAGRFDVPGFVLSSAGLAGIVYAVSVAPAIGWLDPVTLVFGLGALAAFVALVPLELRLDNPLLHLGLLRERLFRTFNLLGVFFYAGFIGLLIVLTLYLQELRGFSAFEAGLTQAPQAIGVFLLSNLAGRRLYRRFGPRPMLLTGIVGAFVSTGALVFVDTTTPLWLIGFAMFVRGISVGAVFLPIQTAIYTNIDTPQLARATSVFNTQRQAAPAFGIAITTTVLATAEPMLGLGADGGGLALGAYRWSFAASALLFVPALIVAFWVRADDAAVTRG
ncbi:MAG: MDR family MFS transporter [Actinomycetota bacterium]